MAKGDITGFDEHLDRETETLLHEAGKEEFDIEERYWEQIDKSIGLITKKRHAERASREKSAFLSNMSHELRTPINAILGMDEMILRECQDEQILEYAGNIRNAGNSLLELINDILDFSKIEAGKMDIIPVDYEVASIINYLVTMIRKRAEDKGLEFIVRVNEKIPRLLHGDEIRIRQVITNILTNAVKYTESGSVALSMDYQEKSEEMIELKVSVKDTGIGIKEEDIEKLFSAFERIEEERNRKIEGTGLGMNITTRLLHMMGSRLKVESVYGEGSEFSFVLEQKVIDRVPVGNLEDAMKRSARAGKKYQASFTAPDAQILVIDDTPMNLSVIKGLLKQTLVQVDTGENGEECLKMIEKKQYDVIFLDQRMSGMDGIETFQVMQEMSVYKEHQMPVIALTANAVAGAREEFLSAGFTDYLTKPVDPEKLENTLVRYLPEEKVQLREKSIDSVSGDGNVSGGADELPAWLSASEVLDTERGLKKCGTADVYINAVKEYVENIMDMADEIERLFQAEDWKNYTIKVHALKSTSAIIGAMNVSERAKELETAGNAGDISTIREKTAPLLEIYRRLFDMLSVPEKHKSRDGLLQISMERLFEAYEAVKEIAASFDYKGVCDVMQALEEYQIPSEESDRYEKLRKAVKNMDWDGITELLS